MALGQEAAHAAAGKPALVNISQDFETYFNEIGKTSKACAG
jgi:hypothetical protein